MENVSICIPFHLRGYKSHPAYEIAFRYYSRLPYPVYLCGSEKSRSRGFAEKFLNDTTYYVEVPQGRATTISKGDHVLRTKFNDSLAALPDSEWRCLVGADDIVPEYFFDWLSRQRHDTPTMAGQLIHSPLLMWDCTKPLTFEALHRVRLNYGIPLKLCGGVNAFNRAGMAAADGKPYQRDGCETGAELLFEDIGQVIGIGGRVTMPKCATVLNPMAKIVARHVNYPVTGADFELVKSLIE